MNSQQNGNYSPRTRLTFTAALLFVILLIYYSSDTAWTSNSPSYGIYRLIPRIAAINFTDNSEATDYFDQTTEDLSTVKPTLNLSPFRYQKRAITQHIDCKRALQNDKDYEFIEDEVKSLFHPENLFCFALDKKASKEFRGQINQLTSCFPNIFVAENEFNINSGGQNMNAAHYECLEMLHKKPHWEYVILLQNYDVIIRTPYELVALYKELGGANDVELTPCPEGRIPSILKNSTAKQLKLFRNESMATERQLNAKMRFAKGAAQVSLSRAAVAWLVDVINITVLIDAFNSMGFGADEQLMESLQVSTELDMPGRFTYDCVEKHHIVDFVSRMSHWTFTSGEGCASNLTRHAICLLGLEDLYSISKYPNIMVNKFMPDFDFAGIDCLHEWIFNRTHLFPFNFDTTYYKEMSNVKYHKIRSFSPKSEPPVDCAPRGKLWHQYMYPT